ncbi:hypothetical protein [Arthrobacter sp. Marseille-P9274]|uniref:hypothetical protein n=1 Tax=Arthrobacter sp. Marseille-P9274 TaxID=2866572 RepID=UPI0021C72CD1|nr:hypothetical protein [Arthrobacter sp. Marseille-P9274]
MNYLKFDDWARLLGAHVEAWQNGTLLETGIVDSVTPDAAIAWLISDPTGERFLLEKANRVELRIDRDQFIRRLEPANTPPGARLGRVLRRVNNQQP